MHKVSEAIELNLLIALIHGSALTLTMMDLLLAAMVLLSKQRWMWITREVNLRNSKYTFGEVVS